MNISFCLNIFSDYVFLPTLNNNNLIRKEIKSAINCDSEKMIKDHNLE